MGTDAPRPARETSGREGREATAGSPPRVVGVWHRTEPSPVIDPGLPAVLELVEAAEGSGRYVGRPGPGEPAYLLWDSGIWLWEAPDRLLLSTSTDAQVTYRVNLAVGRLVIDPDGLNARYHRAAAERPGELDELVEDQRHEEGDQAGPD